MPVKLEIEKAPEIGALVVFDNFLEHILGRIRDIKGAIYM